MAIAAGTHLPATKQATAAIQKARNGRSDSSELPLTTKAGTARNNRVAHTGCGEKRRASDHMANAATSENSMYAAWNGTSRISPVRASSNARNQALRGGCGKP